MNPSSALFLFAVGIAGLFYLDRDNSIRTSKALWIPVIWLWIVGSRPVSSWLGLSPVSGDSQLLDGSPLDRFVFLILLIAGILVLAHRSHRTKVLLRASWPVLIFFSYCLLSVLWSDFSDIAFKRWTKAFGDLVMVLIVVTDAEPRAALKRLVSRTGFILMPASVLLIRYFNNLGRTYDAFSGEPANIGVAIGKNILGVTTLVLSLGAVWRILALLQDSQQPNRGRHLLAQGILLAFGIALLVTANSATSVACFALGTGLMIATSLFVHGPRPGLVHALVLGALVAGGLVMLFGGGANVVHALGRQTNLTGRLAIWDAVVPMAPNPIFGAGFESFWIGPRVQALWRAFPVLHPNEAHNGYIEVYLNLGWMGIALIALVLINGYRRATAVFQRESALGAMLVTYIVVAAIYSITEAGFRMLDVNWIFLLLAVAASDELAEQEFICLTENESAMLPADESSGITMLREQN
jgi:exopolysaccharide production protein ExoQ